MNTREVAEKLCEHCRNGTEAQALETLYADDAESIEPMAPEGMDKISKGKDAIRAKHDWWYNSMEVNSSELEGPFLNGNEFAVVFEIDATDKSSGNRWKAKEVAIYEVEEGKIVKETFYVPSMG